MNNHRILIIMTNMLIRVSSPWFVLFLFFFEIVMSDSHEISLSDTAAHTHTHTGRDTHVRKENYSQILGNSSVRFSLLPKNKQICAQFINQRNCHYCNVHVHTQTHTHTQSALNKNFVHTTHHGMLIKHTKKSRYIERTS